MKMFLPFVATRVAIVKIIAVVAEAIHTRSRPSSGFDFVIYAHSADLYIRET